MQEVLLNEQEKRYTLYPLKYMDIWEYYKKQEATVWNASEGDLSKDKWDELSDDEKHFIAHTLAFFAASDK